MEVVKLEGMNRELAPPGGWDKEKHGECSPLPVFAEVVAGNVTMTSAWKPNAEELAHLVRGAAVALVVYGTVHPPVAIGVFPAEQEVLDGAVEKLRAVLCGPEGQVAINGSDEDKAVVARALAQLELEAQNRPQPASGEVVARALAYIEPHLNAGTFAAPDWAIQLASILTGGDGCGNPIAPAEAKGECERCDRPTREAGAAMGLRPVEVCACATLSTPQPAGGEPASFEEWFDEYDKQNHHPEMLARAAWDAAMLAAAPTPQQPVSDDAAPTPQKGVENPCKCIDCGGSEPGHSDDCTYMKELHGHD